MRGSLQLTDREVRLHVLERMEQIERKSRGGKWEYRALISVPIGARSDDDAVNIACLYAQLLLHPGSTCVAGHAECVIADEDDDRERIVYEDPMFTGLHGLKWQRPGE